MATGRSCVIFQNSYTKKITFKPKDFVFTPPPNCNIKDIFALEEDTMSLIESYKNSDNFRSLSHWVEFDFDQINKNPKNAKLQNDYIICKTSFRKFKKAAIILTKFMFTLKKNDAKMLISFVMQFRDVLSKIYEIR